MNLRWWIHTFYLPCILAYTVGMKILLPIFPLRKRVKLPGESMHLRLWEPRYIALSDYIRIHDHADLGHVMNTFGAIYSSQKPQLVAGGRGPITPIIDRGDVGVMCQVIQYRDSYNSLEPDDTDDSECVDSTGDCNRTRVVELECVTTQRFRVERIIQNGISPCTDSLPFILVEAMILNDHEAPAESDEIKAIAKRLDERYKHFDGTNTMLSENIEILSFKLLSRISERMSARELLPLLETSSTKERLAFLERNMYL